jgi:hypothetical protein
MATPAKDPATITPVTATAVAIALFLFMDQQ